MSIQLTEEQLRAAEASPVRVTDPTTRREYVLIGAEVYEQVKALFADADDRQAVRDLYPLIDRSFADGWDDPKMDDYDHYEQHRP
jgi:hypothetical protein